MEAFDFHSDTRVCFGPGRLAELGTEARALTAGPVLLVADPGVAAAGITGRAHASLQAAGLDVVLYDRVQENPTTEHVDAGVEIARRAGPVAAIVGLGGGSAMDCAKGINFVLTNGGTMEDYWGDGRAAQPLLPSLGVPTTAGTGSEAQRYALIARADDHQKMACGDTKARFRTVLLDPDVLSTAPPRVIAAAAVDAVAHAVESFVCTRATPLSRLFAREALRLLDEHVEGWIASPGSGPVAAAMQLGAHWAGAAIEHSMLGAAHACANPLTSRYGITHGVAVGLMLPHVVRFNSAVASRGYGELARAANLPAAAGALADRVQAVGRAAGLPARLRDLGVEEPALEAMAPSAARQKTAEFNPRRLGPAECAGLYRAAF